MAASGASRLAMTGHKRSITSGNFRAGCVGGYDVSVCAAEVRKSATPLPEMNFKSGAQR